MYTSRTNRKIRKTFWWLRIFTPQMYKISSPRRTQSEFNIQRNIALKCYTQYLVRYFIMSSTLFNLFGIKLTNRFRVSVAICRHSRMTNFFRWFMFIYLVRNRCFIWSPKYSLGFLSWFCGTKLSLWGLW